MNPDYSKTPLYDLIEEYGRAREDCGWLTEGSKPHSNSMGLANRLLKEIRNRLFGDIHESIK